MTSDLDPHDAELVRTLFTRAVDAIEDAHEACMRGQRRGLDPARVTDLAEHAGVLCREASALLAAVRKIAGVR